MILTAVVAVDVAVLIQSASLGFGIEFPLFIASVLLTLNLFFATYLKAADRMNAAPPEQPDRDGPDPRLPGGHPDGPDDPHRLRRPDARRI